MKALLSIKPEYAEKIFSGEKRFEFRKARFKQAVQTVVVYATMPVGKIVGEFDVDTIIAASPEALWTQTKPYAGISHSHFAAYFTGKTVGYAIKIKKINKYTHPKDPYKDIPDFTPPQSFRYID